MTGSASPARRPDTAGTPVEPASPGQQQRRRRILQAAAELAGQGDYEAVHMRLVAERADVAIGTLYRYFASKIDLLVAVMVDRLHTVSVELSGHELPGDTAFDRVMWVVGQAIQDRRDEPRLHSAMLRAYVFAGEASPPESAQVSFLVQEILANAVRAGATIGAADREIAAVLSDVWLSATVGSVAGRLTHDGARAKMERAARLLLAA